MRREAFFPVDRGAVEAPCRPSILVMLLDLGEKSAMTSVDALNRARYLLDQGRTGEARQVLAEAIANGLDGAPVRIHTSSASSRWACGEAGSRRTTVR